MDDNLEYCGAGMQQFHSGYIKVHGWLSLLVCSFGLVANFIIIIVLTRKSMISPTNIILTGLAVADALVMAEYVPYSVHVYLDDRSGREKHTFGWAVFVLFHANFTQVCHTISIWLTVTLAIWRFLAVSQPTNQPLWNNAARAKIAIVIAFLGAVIICAPTYIAFAVQEYRTHSNESIWAVGPSHIAKSNNKIFEQLNFWFYGVCIKIIPCIALTFLSGYLIKAILDAKKRRKSLKANENQKDRTTGMLVSVVLLFIITEFPQGILSLLSALLGEAFFRNCYNSLGDLMDILALVNSAINFVLYCCMSKQFRDTFGLLFRGKKDAPLAPPVRSKRTAVTTI